MHKRVVLGMLFVSLLSGCDSQSVEEGSGDAEITLSVYMEDTLIDSLSTAEVDATETVVVRGESYKAVSIASVIGAATGQDSVELERTLAEYLCDYESSTDGFRPTSKGDRCPMVSCSYAYQSYVDLDTGNLFYSEEAPMTNGCYSVRGLSKVLMYKANPNAALIHLYVNGTWIAQIDADKLESKKVIIDGKEAVTLESVIQAASPDQVLEGYACDFRDGTQLFSEADESCKPSDCDEIKDQYIILKDRTISDGDASSGLCYENKSIDAVYMVQHIEQYDPYEIEITVDHERVGKVDLSSLTDKAYFEGGLAVVHVSDIIEASGLKIDYNNTYCDYGAEDGYRPNQRRDCVEVRSCLFAQTSYVALATHKLSAVPTEHACYNVMWLTSIDIYTTNPNE